MKPHKNSGDMFTFKSLSFDPTSSSGQQTPPHVLFLKCVHHSFNVGGAFETASHRVIEMPTSRNQSSSLARPRSDPVSQGTVPPPHHTARFSKRPSMTKQAARWRSTVCLCRNRKECWRTHVRRWNMQSQWKNTMDKSNHLHHLPSVQHSAWPTNSPVVFTGVWAKSCHRRRLKPRNWALSLSWSWGSAWKLTASEFMQRDDQKKMRLAMILATYWLMMAAAMP